jgi:hypothetical protein
MGRPKELTMPSKDQTWALVVARIVSLSVAWLLWTAMLVADAYYVLTAIQTKPSAHEACDVRCDHRMDVFGSLVLQEIAQSESPTRFYRQLHPFTDNWIADLGAVRGGGDLRAHRVF